MRNKLPYLFLAAVFAAAASMHYGHAGYIWQFFWDACAVLLAAWFLGKATESTAHYAGERVGGFLNATFGNAAELIIAIFLVKDGLFDMVKASITGSIIGNLLLVLGLSVLAGGLKYKTQTFNVLLASHNASLETIAVIALFIPALFVKSLTPSQVNTASLLIACILIAAYLLWLVFSMITHKEQLNDLQEEGDREHAPKWSRGRSFLFLALATILVALVSDWLVGTLEPMARTFGFSELFLGAFLIAIIGNAAEHAAAVQLALKNKIGAAVEIAIGSSLQIALFVGPLLILISWMFGQRMNIIFSSYEIAAIAVAVFISKAIAQDGKTNWYEGVLLLVVYLILAIVFYLLP